jgi:hypothetical protein
MDKIPLFFISNVFVEGLRKQSIQPLPQRLKISMKRLLIFFFFSSLSLAGVAQGGYFGEIKFNMNVGQKSNLFGRFPYGVALLTNHGYGFKDYFGISAGTGIIHESIDYATFSPFFLQVSSAPLKKLVSPHASFDIGYNYQWRKGMNDEFTNIKGGLYLHPQVGIKVGKGPVYGIIGIGWTRFDSKVVYVTPGTPDRTVFSKSYKRYTFNLALGF